MGDTKYSEVLGTFNRKDVSVRADSANINQSPAQKRSLVTYNEAIAMLGTHPYKVDGVELMTYSIILEPTTSFRKTYVAGILHDFQRTGCGKKLSKKVKFTTPKGRWGVVTPKIEIYSSKIGADILGVYNATIDLIKNPTLEHKGLDYFRRNPLPIDI